MRELKLSSKKCVVVASCVAYLSLVALEQLSILAVSTVKMGPPSSSLYTTRMALARKGHLFGTLGSSLNSFNIA